jgi:hypothetical protein
MNAICSREALVAADECTLVSENIGIVGPSTKLLLTSSNSGVSLWSL